MQVKNPEEILCGPYMLYQQDKRKSFCIMSDNAISQRSYKKENNDFVIAKVNRISCKDLTKAVE